MGSLFGAASGRSRRRRQVSLVVESAVGWKRHRLQEQISPDPPGLIFGKSERYRHEGPRPNAGRATCPCRRNQL